VEIAINFKMPFFLFREMRAKQIVKNGLIYFLIISVTVIIGLGIFETVNYVGMSKVDYSYVWSPGLKYVFSPDPGIFHGDKWGFSFYN